MRIAKKKFEKSLDLANFVNFLDLPQGVGGTTPTPYWRTLDLSLHPLKFKYPSEKTFPVSGC